MSDAAAPLPGNTSWCERPRMSDGVELALRVFPTPQTPRGLIVALHGIQSHSLWFAQSSKCFAEAGWEVRFLDRRGSGHSAGPRGHAEHWERLLNDVVSILIAARCETPPRPVVLLAVSWGAKLAAAVASLRPDLIDGIILLYPGIESRFAPRLPQRILLRLADWLGLRRRKVLVPLTDSALFTSSPDWRRFIECDPLAVHVVTTGFLIADRELTRLARAAPERLNCPLLLMLAGRDRITNNPAMRRWFARVRFADKHLVEFPDAEHTLEFEPCLGDMVHEVASWLNDRFPR